MPTTYIFNENISILIRPFLADGAFASILKLKEIISFWSDSCLVRFSMDLLSVILLSTQLSQRCMLEGLEVNGSRTCGNIRIENGISQFYMHRPKNNLTRMSQDACKKKWEKAVQTDAHGAEISGSKARLQKDVLNGRRIKFVQKNIHYHLTEVNDCESMGAEVCCQTLQHVSVDNEDSFDAKGSWCFIVACTAGHIHMQRYSIGGEFVSQRHIRANITWFTLQNNDIGYPLPVFGRGFGSPEKLRSAVLQGMAITVILQNHRRYAVENCELSGVVSCQLIWNFRVERRKRHVRFNRIAAFNFMMVTSLGTTDRRRWYVEYHRQFNQRPEVNKVCAWFADDCWAQIHISDGNGSRSQTLKQFMFLVEQGHAVRVHVYNTVMKVEGIRISRDHISVYLVSLLARENLKSFTKNLSWVFRVVSTSGTVKTYRLGLSKTVYQSIITERKSFTWFVDTKRWFLLLHTLRNGSISKGAISALSSAVSNGVDIRIAFKCSQDSGFSVFGAHNIHLGPEHHVTAQVVRVLRDYESENGEFVFDRIPIWSFKLISTKGFVITSDWGVQTGKHHSQQLRRAEIKWFASF